MSITSDCDLPTVTKNFKANKIINLHFCNICHRKSKHLQILSLGVKYFTHLKTSVNDAQRIDFFFFLFFLNSTSHRWEVELGVEPKSQDSQSSELSNTWCCILLATLRNLLIKETLWTFIIQVKLTL